MFTETYDVEALIYREMSVKHFISQTPEGILLEPHLKLEQRTRSTE